MVRPHLPLALCLSWMAAQQPALADGPTFDYALRTGYDSNLFSDPNKLGGAFAEAETKMRGTVDGDGASVSYSLWHRERRLSDYRFGNEQATGGGLGLKGKLSDKVEFSLEGALSALKTGDVLVAAGDTVIGYHSTDLNYSVGAGLGAEMLGGKTTFQASLNRIDRGKAHFTTDLLLPSKIKADETTLNLISTHIRPAFNGELGATVAFRSTFVPDSQQEALQRFPASTLRGSIAYGHKLGANATLVLEGGAIGIISDALADSAQRVHPYIHTALEWKATRWLGLGAGYDRDLATTDLDDPLAEYISTLKFVAALNLTDKVDAKFAYEIASSDWFYYVYDTRTRRFTGTLTYKFAKDHKLELEYRRIDRSETDPAQDFTGNQYVARISGSF